MVNEAYKMQRNDGRRSDQLRDVRIRSGEIKYAEGSALIEMGDTKVLCTASVEESVPPFLRESGTGWVTAEYSMLPRSTRERNKRESVKGRIGGRSHEIQRLIGRVIRSVIDFQLLGERTIILDCDVIQADGGTRTASITGAYVALSLAVQNIIQNGMLENNPVTDSVAAVSVGILDDLPILDLNYDEDSKAEVDMNIAMTGSGRFIEIQGTAEKNPFSAKQLGEMLDLGKKGIEDLLALQKETLSNS